MNGALKQFGQRRLKAVGDIGRSHYPQGLASNSTGATMNENRRRDECRSQVIARLPGCQ